MGGSLPRTKFSLRVFVMTTLSCTMNMVTGNMLLISPQHLVIASKVGLVCAGGFILVSLTTNSLMRSKYFLAGYVFAATTVVDFFSHASHFGNDYAEALSTGLCAALLSLLGSFILDRQPDQLHDSVNANPV